MFLASIEEPGVGAFDQQNLRLRPVPIAAERLEIQVGSVFTLSREERVRPAPHQALWASGFPGYENDIQKLGCQK